MALRESISGIRGTIGGKYENNLTPIHIVNYVSAYSKFIYKKGEQSTVVVGRDGRITGETIKELVIGVFKMCGINIIDLDYTTTPTLEMCIINKKANGGIVISASHNPMEWNALKLLNDRGEFIDQKGIDEIKKTIDFNTYEFADIYNQGVLTHYDKAIEDHIEAILKLDILDISLIRNSNFKVVIDPVNSTGGLALQPLLDRLNCEVIMINEQIHGRFNHVAEPKPENLVELCQAVIDFGADLGVAVDPDADRLALIDERGVCIGEEYSVVVAADFVLAKNPAPTVSNLSSSRALRDISSKYHCTYHASAVGEANVVEKMKKVNSSIGGEGNGGVIYPALHYGRDALIGVVFALNLMAERKKAMSEIKKTYSDYFIVKDKINLSDNLNVEAIYEKVIEAFMNEEIDTEDGVKVDFDEGWVHLRKSNTEEIIRIYAEAASENLALNLINQLKRSIQ